MIDSSQIMTAATFLGSGLALRKLLGPTADYLGEGIRDLIKQSVENLGRVFLAAHEKLGPKIEDPGGVSARVLKSILEEGRFLEDAFAAEYFGGLLAASRDETGRDDSLLPDLSLIKTMPAMQFRLHFLVYRLVAELPYGRDVHELPDLWNGLLLTIPGAELSVAIGPEANIHEHDIYRALTGLMENGLIEKQHAFRLRRLCKRFHEAIPEEDCLLIRPNRRGADLFLKALGHRNLDVDTITSVEVDFRLSTHIRDAVKLPAGSSHSFSPVANPLAELRGRFEDLVYDLETKVDDLADDLDDLKNDDEEFPTEDGTAG